MLTRVNGPVDDTGAAVAIKDASFPAPFASGLEYAAPARGTWNIVHVGMLIPQAHQIFVCAQGCLRGVVLTAAEMGAQERFSTVAIEEHNVLGGLGDAVASVIAESGKGCVFKKHGMQDTFATIGYAEDLYSYYGLDANGIVDKVREMMGMEFEPDENWEDD